MVAGTNNGEVHTQKFEVRLTFERFVRQSALDEELVNMPAISDSPD